MNCLTICADTKYLDFICDGYARGIDGTIYIGFGGLHKNGQICINYTLFSSVWSFEVCLAHEPYIRQYQKRPSGTTRLRKPTKRGRTTIQMSAVKRKQVGGQVRFRADMSTPRSISYLYKCCNLSKKRNNISHQPAASSVSTFRDFSLF